MPAKKVDKFLNNNESLPINITIDYTPDQVMEMRKCMDDPIYFAENFFVIVHLDKGRQKIKLFDAQKRAIRNIIDNKRTIICASRQIGKSTLMTIVCLWYVIFRKDFQVAILANKEDQAKEILERIKLAYEELPNWLKTGVSEFTKEVLKLVNGSKIFVSTTSESGIRGKSVNMLFVDEFAHIATQIAEPFFKSVMPTISSAKSSKIVLISCVTKDTHVFTENGIFQIEEFINEEKEKGYYIPSYKVLGKNKTRTGDIMFVLQTASRIDIT
jgi:hypothetical protein